MAIKTELVEDEVELPITQEETSTSVVIKDSDILNPNYNFDDKITVATEVATSLKKVIETQKLAVNIQGNSYVTSEGWETLGTMLGCTSYVESVEEIQLGDKSYKYGYIATVSIRQGDRVISRASALAERNNSQKERHAVYSMAQTRALGKAYRMALSWIIKLAGYKQTPAEEMPQFKGVKSEQ